MSHAIARTIPASVWGMIVLLSLLWGGSFLFNGIVLREVPVLSIVAVRVGLAALALHLVLRWKGIRFPLEREALYAFFVMGLLNNALPFTLIVFGQSRITSGMAAILNATTPLFTMLVAHACTQDEKIGFRKGLGAMLGCGGVVVLVSGRDLIDAGPGSTLLLGQAACLLAAFFYGCAGIYGRRFARRGLPPVSVAAGQLTMSALLMIPIALLVDHPFDHPLPGLEAITALVALALVSSAAAYIVFFRILVRAGATAVSLVTLLIPCSAIMLGVLVLGEPFQARALAGFLMIAAALLVIDGRLFPGRHANG